MYKLETFSSLKSLHPSLNGRLFYQSDEYRKQVLALVAEQEQIMEQLTAEYHDVLTQIKSEKAQ